jgi:hypothetical protein
LVSGVNVILAYVVPVLELGGWGLSNRTVIAVYFAVNYGDRTG